MYIQFRYDFTETHILDFMTSTIQGFNDYGCLGYMNQQDLGILKDCSLYLLCESDFSKDTNLEIRTNPILIVAKNTQTAMEYYYDITGNNNGTVACEVRSNCAGLKVQPTGECVERNL